MKLSRLEMLIVVLCCLVLLGTYVVSRTLAEQSSGSPDSGDLSILKETYENFLNLNHGDEQGDPDWGNLGPYWNRVISSAVWTPEENIEPSDVVKGVQYYNRLRQSETGTYEGISCPEGMILVPSGDGGAAFCVDKYEVKNIGGLAVSQVSGTPWVSITQFTARAACKLVGKHLITEQEWLQIARNVEQVGWNWSGGTPGSGVMSDGHSDGSPSSPLAASSDDNNSCFGTGQTCDINTWDSQRRTYKLSNGEYIWDLGGNVAEWVEGFTFEHQPYLNNWSGLRLCTTPDNICGNTFPTNDTRYGGNTAELRGLVRGGSYYWSDGTRTGAFMISFSSFPSGSVGSLGFRCAW